MLTEPPAETGTDYYHSVGYEYDLKNNLTNLVEIINGTERTTSYTYDDDNRLTVSTNGAVSTHYYYDDFGRVKKQETKQNGTPVLTEYYTFTATESGTSAQVATYRTVSAAANGYDVTYTYTYDDNGNILTVSDGTYTTSYVYDSQNQLIRENNQQKNRTYVWTYDAAGNRLSSKSCSYTLDENPNVYGQEFTYGDNEWGDLMTDRSGWNIQNDALGNLTMMEDTELYDSYYSYTWEHGRELAVFGDYMFTGREWECTYDANGMRTKRANSIEGEYTYVYDGNLLSSMAVNNHTLYFTYDATGTPLTVTLDGTTYYYVTNVQGDVVAILDASGNTAVTYTYDAWGNHSSYGNANSNLAFYNPLRYRGYVYDEELYMYYVASRYYDPGLGRWISADDVGLLGANGDFASLNLFAYCGNNPVARADYNGEWWNVVIGAVVGAVVSAATTAINGGSLGEVLVSGACGAVSGAFAATGFGGVAGQMIVGAVTSAVDSGYQNYNDYREGDKTLEQAICGTLVDATLGAAFSATGADGTDALKTSNKMAKTYKQAKKTLKTEVLHPNVRTSANATISACKKYITETIKSTWIDEVISTTVNTTFSKIGELYVLGR